MKKTRLLILLISFVFQGFSQTSATLETTEKNAPEGKVTYVFVSNKLQNLEIVREAELFFNEQGSKYVHSKGEDPVVYLNGVDESEGFYIQDEIGNVIYKNFLTDSLKIREIVYLEPYTSAETIPSLDWKITNTTKKIGSFTTKLATTKFRGRNYNAWFTEEIPISDGPWKFSGLPGLILEVVSENEDYQFLFKSIEMPLRSSNEEIIFENEGIHLDFKEFVNAEDLEFQKMKKESEARWLSSGGEPGGFKTTKMPTNPIELTYD